MNLPESLISYFHAARALLCCTLILFFILISSPVYIFRFLLSVTKKYIRPELGDMLGGQSSILANDYFSPNPPRSNIVITSTFSGQVTLKAAKKLVLKNWINCAKDENGNEVYRKFKQYPIQWLGFSCWKDDDTFSVDNHVENLFADGVQPTEEMVEEQVEKLLNQKFPPGRSPWNGYIVPNYVDPSEPEKKQFLVIFKIHHCLADGFSIISATVEGLFEGNSLKSMPFPTAKPPERSFMEKVSYYGLLPIQVMSDMTELFSHMFHPHPWRVPDHKKDWYQIYCKTNPIPVQTIKNIKDTHGVTFTSVILSSVSSAICKSFNDDGLSEDNTQLFTILPVPNRNISDVLTNNASGTLLNLPCTEFKSSVDRLKRVNTLLVESRKSTHPLAMTTVLPILGNNFQFVSKYLCKNRYVQVGMTNFPGLPSEIEVYGRKWIDNGFIVGGLEGNIGVIIAVVSHLQHIRIEVCAERAIMSKEKLKKFIGYITEEIQHLQKQSVKHFQVNLETKSG